VDAMGAAYLWAKPGSETVIRWAHICNLGRSATNKTGLVFGDVDGANAAEGVTVEWSWIREMGKYGIQHGGRNNTFLKGIRGNRIMQTLNYGIAVTGGTNSSISLNRISGTTNSVSVEAGASNTRVVSNHMHGNRGLNASGAHDRGRNTTFADDQLYGNDARARRGLPMLRSTVRQDGCQSRHERNRWVTAPTEGSQSAGDQKWSPKTEALEAGCEGGAVLAVQLRGPAGRSRPPAPPPLRETLDRYVERRHQGQRAQDEGEGGHQDGAEADPCGLPGRLAHVEPALAALPGEFHDEDRVLAGCGSELLLLCPVASGLLSPSQDVYVKPGPIPVGRGKQVPGPGPKGASSQCCLRSDGSGNRRAGPGVSCVSG